MNRTVQDLTFKHISDHPTANWVTALPFVQFKYNIRMHKGTRKSPYELMFGSRPRLGVGSLGIPEEEMSNLAGQLDADPEGPREEHLFACLDTLGITSEALLDVQHSPLY